MRIVLTTNFSPWSPYSGGGQRSTHNLAIALCRRGHEVTVIYTKAAGEDIVPSEIPPYEIRWARLIGRTSRRDSPLRPLNAVTVAGELTRLLSAQRVHAVHGNGEEAALFSAVRQRYRFVFVMTPRYPSYPAPMLRPSGPTALERARLVVEDGKYLVLGEALRRADWICPTSQSASRMIQTAYRLDHSRIRVISNGVDDAFFSVQWSKPSAAQADVVFFGRLSHSKGADVLVEALASLPTERRPRCRIIGRGEAEPHLRARIAASGLGETVELVGWKSAVELAEILKSAAMVVLPSREESFGNAVAESMAAGAPIITTRVGSVPELIEDGLTGLLVEPDDPQGLALAIDALLTDPDRAATLGARARQQAQERYAWDAVAESFERLYRAPPR